MFQAAAQTLQYLLHIVRFTRQEICNRGSLPNGHTIHSFW